MSRVIHLIGTTGLPSLFTSYRKEMPFTVSNAELGVVDSIGSGSLSLVGRDTGTGSNGWVIAGSRTASGKPILANEMHLDQQMPAIWYQVGLHGVDADGQSGRTKECPFDVFGYSLPGVPGVVSGHNDRIAWGMMDLGGDVQDLYLERTNPENPDQYLVDGRWTDMTFVYEEIPVRKAKEPYRLRVRLTRHGPVISDHGPQTALESFMSRSGATFPENIELTSVALRWSVLQPSNVIAAELKLDQAENYEQFRDALRNWYAPALNIVYADVDGNIAYQCVGRIPIRAEGSGEAPVPGWTSEFEWTGYIPFDELPRSLNPPKGYIVNANNPPAASAYSHLLGTELDYGYRARRIVEMIESSKGPLGVKEIEEFERMQKARDMVLGWDGRMSGKSGPAALYAYVWVQLVTEIFRDQYPETEWPMKASSRAENAVHFLLQDPENRFWDDITTPERETRDEILVRAFRRGYQQLVEKAGKNPKKWRWDKIHTITFVNQTLGKSGISLIEKIFNRGPYPVGGGPTQVNAEGWDRKKPFDVLHIPSMRQIVDMADLTRTRTILPTGQSGHPGNRHYADMVDRWRKVQYQPALWDRKEIEKQSEGRLLLLPK